MACKHWNVKTSTCLIKTQPFLYFLSVPKYCDPSEQTTCEFAVFEKEEVEEKKKTVKKTTKKKASV